MNTVALLSAEVRAAVELRRWLENERAGDSDFDDLVLDAIEGETRLNELAASLIREALLTEKMAEACSARINEIASRKERLIRRADSLRAAVGRAMDEAGVPKITAPDVTISYRQGSIRPYVEDENQLPDEFVRVKIERRPDLRKIGDFIGDTGRAIPGVVLRNGAPTLTARTK
jgi:hypothetical protein